jgi:hypothetical protein
MDLGVLDDAFELFGLRADLPFQVADAVVRHGAYLS